QHEIMRELRRFADARGALLLGETEALAFYGNGRNELHSLFNFKWANQTALHAQTIRNTLRDRWRHLPPGAWECNTVGNHDRPRSYTSIMRGDAHDDARYLAMLALTAFLPGTPMYYNGEEIGLRDHYLTDPEQLKDGIGIYIYNVLRERGVDQNTAVYNAQHFAGRDKCRAPMQWHNAPHGGFCPPEVEPWLPVHPNYAEGINVAAQRYRPDSLLARLRDALLLRREYPALRRGAYDLIEATGDVFAFWRAHRSGSCLVAANLSAEPLRAALGMAKVRRVYSSSYGVRVLATQADRHGAHYEITALALQPYEVFVGLL
ncbi:MAG: alpha-amylase family glycosyl hydrolase, partial [Anaerolineales bacterium]